MDQTVTLDVRKRSGMSSRRIELDMMRRGEKGNVDLTVHVIAGGYSYDLTGKQVYFRSKSSQGRVVFDDSSAGIKITDAEGGVLSHTLPSEFASEPGTMTAYYEIRQNDSFLDTTESFTTVIANDIDLSAESAEDYVSEFDRIASDAQKATDAANEAARNALAEASAANAAKQGAVTAAANANAAASSANKVVKIVEEVATAEEYDRQHIINSYDGRSLASAFASEIGGTDIYTWLRDRVRAANFAGLRIGDYIDVPITEGANVPAQTVRYRIGGIDQYYQCGDTPMGHHIVMVPKAPVTVKGDKASDDGHIQWRDTANNNGTADEKHPYLLSKLHDWEINDFLPALPATLKSAIMTQRVLLEERYTSGGGATESSGYSWVDLGKVWSPSEMEVYGCPVWGTKGYSVGLDSQLPIFTDTASRIAGGRVSWWLRSVADGSSSRACYVSGAGPSSSYTATDDDTRPMPCFLLG